NAQPGETRGGTQLPRQGPLLTRAVECLQEIAIGRRDSLRGSFQQDQFALDALQLGQAPAPFTAFATRQRLIDGQEPLRELPRFGDALRQCAEKRRVVAGETGGANCIERAKEQAHAGMDIAALDMQYRLEAAPPGVPYREAMPRRVVE